MTDFKKITARSSLLLLAISSLALSSCASKPDRRGPPPDRQGQAGQVRTSGTFMMPSAALFTGMDANNDKIVSRSEMQSGAQAEWARFSGNPSAVNFAKWSMVNLGSTDAMPNFMSFDHDFNGVISQAEFAKQLENEFKRQDKNNDGKLERSELIVAFQAPQGRSRDSAGQGSRPERGQGGGGRSPRR